MIKGPIIQLFEDKIKSGITDLVADYITAIPILLGVSVAVYAVCNMFSSKLANLSVFGVFVYGALVILL